MTTSYHLTFHADRPAVSVASMLATQLGLALSERDDDGLGRHWYGEQQQLADSLVVAGFTPALPHECPDKRHKSYVAAAFSTGRPRDRGARRDYLLRLVAHLDGVTLVSQDFDNN